MRMLKGLLTCASGLALVVGANLSMVTTATAQDGDRRGEGRSAGTAIEEVVVTARRFEENLQEVPVAVTAINNVRLQELVVNNVQDLNKLSPSLQSSSCSGQRNTCFNPTIRGQGTAGMTNQPSVASYFGDVPSFNLSYYDLQSVQVLKGPQGTLFGETATGGALLFTPRKPGNVFEGYARAQVGNYAYKAVELAVGGPIIADKLMFRLAGQIRNRNGFTKAYASFPGGGTLADPEDFDNVDNVEWRASLVWKPLENLENYTIYAGARYKLNGTGQFVYYANQSFMNPAVRNVIPANTPATVAAFIAFTGQPPPAGRTWGQLAEDALTRQLAIGPRALYYNYSRASEVRFNGIINQTRWDIADSFRIKNIYGLYWTRNRGATIDTDGTDLPFIDTTTIKNPPASGAAPDRRLGGDAAWLNGWPSRNWSDEVQASGELFDDRLKWQAGYFYKDVRQRDFVGPSNTIIVLGASQALVTAAATCTNTFGVAPPCTTLLRSVNKSTGAYAQGTFEVAPSVSLTAGYRRSTEYRRTDTTAGPLSSFLVNGVSIPLVQKTDPFPNANITSLVVPKKSYTNYALSLDWKVNDDVLLYVAHRKGYKGGGINNNAPADSPLRTFGPESIKDAEFGLKSDWRLGEIRGRTNIALYQDWYKDIQRTSLIPGQALTLTSNLADAVIKGLEFETTAEFNDWFDVTFFVAYTDPKYKDWIENSTCGAQFYRPQCAGLPTTTPIVIDHSNGALVVAGNTTRFKPDVFRETSKIRWGVQPAIHLTPWLNEEITLKANIYHRSKGQWGTADSNTSLTAGNIQPRNSVFGLVNDPGIMPGYTLADLRIDWRNIRGSRVSGALSVTNIADKTVMVGGSGGLTLAGITPGIANEPRMWFLELSYEFGGN